MSHCDWNIAWFCLVTYHRTFLDTDTLSSQWLNKNHLRRKRLKISEVCEGSSSLQGLGSSSFKIINPLTPTRFGTINEDVLIAVQGRNMNYTPGAGNRVENTFTENSTLYKHPSKLNEVLTPAHQFQQLRPLNITNQFSSYTQIHNPSFH